MLVLKNFTKLIIKNSIKNVYFNNKIYIKKYKVNILFKLVKYKFYNNLKFFLILIFYKKINL